MILLDLRLLYNRYAVDNISGVITNMGIVTYILRHPETSPPLLVELLELESLAEGVVEVPGSFPEGGVVVVSGSDELL